MGFIRPVDTLFDIATPFRERSRKYTWSIDPDNGVWVPMQDHEGMGEHHGIDFSCPSGTPVRAVCDGIILKSRFENAIDTSVGAGLHIMQLVKMLGYDCWAIRYSHLKSSFVTPGDNVKQGQSLGESGKSGDASYSYLHIDLMNLHYQWKDIPWS